MDLRTQFPRSMRTTLAGYAHLARMIDKCRAVLAGTEGEYIYPCPMDERLMDFAGITSEQFTAAVKTHPTDEGVETWFRKTAQDPIRTAELEAWNKRALGARAQFSGKRRAIQEIPRCRRSFEDRHYCMGRSSRSRGRPQRTTALTGRKCRPHRSCLCGRLKMR